MAQEGWPSSPQTPSGQMLQTAGLRLPLLEDGGPSRSEMNTQGLGVVCFSLCQGVKKADFKTQAPWRAALFYLFWGGGGWWGEGGFEDIHVPSTAKPSKSACQTRLVERPCYLAVRPS